MFSLSHLIYYVYNLSRQSFIYFKHIRIIHSAGARLCPTSSLRSTLTASLTGTAPQRVHLECGPDEGDGQDRPPRGLRRPPPVGAAAWGLSALGAQLNKIHLDTRAALVVTVGRLLTARAGRRFLTKLNEDFKLIHFYNAALILCASW